MKKLNRNKAIEHITPVIDGEATEEQAKALFEYLQQDEYVRNLYESEQEIKAFIRNNYNPVKAPESVSKFAESVAISDIRDFNPDDDKSISSVKKEQYTGKNFKYLWVAAAAIFVISLTFLLRPDIINTGTAHSSVVVEEQIGEHYNALTSAGAPEPEVTNPDRVSYYISDHYNAEIKVPELANVSFKGLIDSEFISGFDTPLFSFLCPEDHQIFVFAFDLEQMDERIKPDEEAKRTNHTDGGYHVTDLGDQNVISWQEDNIWYAAISPHDEERYADMLGR